MEARRLIGDRDRWATQPDASLLAECDVDTYRASGPGGQKRNKTSSAVRLRHRHSGLIVIAEESRSQHENRARALRRLRRELFLRRREPIRLDEVSRDARRLAVADESGRLDNRASHAGYWPAVGLVLDVLETTRGGVREAAQALGTGSANLINFLYADVQAWQAANQLRTRYARPPLNA